MYKGEQIRYEWVIEPTDEFGDILEVFHADTYSEAQALAASIARDFPEGHRTAVGLVRDRGSDFEGIEDRQWAYIHDGRLPECFDGGSKVPARFHAEVARASAAIAKLEKRGK